MQSLHPMRVGLTGGIGSGKTTVAGMLAALGALVIDTDRIAHELTAPGGAAIPDIRTEFGAEFIDASGAMDRARMRDLAFRDPAAKQRLEALLHPRIGAQVEALAAAATPGQTCVFDVPLLVESRRWRERVARVVVVDCEEAVQIERVRARSGLSADAVQRIIAQQATRTQRLLAADHVIFNVGLSLAQLEAEVRSLWDHLRAGNR